MKLTPEQELEIALMKVNYHTICDLFELTPEQRLNPTCGQWVVDTIKQFQTSYTIMKAAKLLQSETSDTLPLTPLPTENPLLTNEEKNGIQ